jgi:hypothetical protein
LFLRRALANFARLNASISIFRIAHAADSVHGRFVLFVVWLLVMAALSIKGIQRQSLTMPA